VCIRDAVREAVVLDAGRVVDGDVRRSFLEILRRVTLFAHHLRDQRVGLTDGVRRRIDKPSLNLLPLLAVVGTLLERERTDLELFAPLLPAREFRLGLAPISACGDGPLILRSEPLSQVLTA